MRDEYSSTDAIIQKRTFDIGCPVDVIVRGNTTLLTPKQRQAIEDILGQAESSELSAKEIAAHPEAAASHHEWAADNLDMRSPRPKDDPAAWPKDDQ